jgi:hypothetical protein
MRKHVRGLLANASPSEKKEVTRELEKAHQEMVRASIQAFLARRALEKTLYRILYGAEYLDPGATQ